MEWLDRFPRMQEDALLHLKRSIDDGFRAFTGAYGDSVNDFFEPLQQFLILAERFMLRTPWPIIMLMILTLAWVASRNWRVVLGSFLTLAVIGYLDMWQDTMRTVSMISVCTILAIVIGLPIGIAMATSERVRRIIAPILDVMQTLPSFVYLIPVVMLLGIGRVPGLIAVVTYSVPPMIRLTNLGIRLVDREILEAADAFGSSGWQRLIKVQLPLALPTIMAGVNQTIMMALAMVTVGAMIGVEGLGQPVLKAIANQYFTLGIFNGLAIVGIAVMFDRVSQAYGQRLQKHREVVHG